MGKKIFRWFRRTHDVLAVILCCLWVAGWFFGVRYYSFHDRSFQYWSIDASFLYAFGADEKTGIEVGRIEEYRGIFVGRPMGIHRIGNTDRSRLIHEHTVMVERVLHGVSPIVWNPSPDSSRNYKFGIPSILVASVFLIWPMGRLTHRIARRKSADA
jgi:hypothetical protein